MRRGDEDLRNTIQDYRQVWKRYALAWSTLPLFPSLGASPSLGGPGALYHGLRRLFQLLQRVLVDFIFFSRGFGHRAAHPFPFLPARGALGRILVLTVVYAYQHDATNPKGLQANWEQSWPLWNCFPAEQF